MPIDCDGAAGHNFKPSTSDTSSRRRAPVVPKAIQHQIFSERNTGNTPSNSTVIPAKRPRAPEHDDDDDSKPANSRGEPCQSKQNGKLAPPVTTRKLRHRSTIASLQKTYERELARLDTVLDYYGGGGGAGGCDDVGVGREDIWAVSRSGVSSSSEGGLAHGQPEVDGARRRGGRSRSSGGPPGRARGRCRRRTGGWKASRATRWAPACPT